MAGTGEPNKFLPSEVLGNAKVAAESAQTTVGKQGEKVATAAEGVKKTVVEHIDRAADYVHSKPEEPAKTEEGSGEPNKFLPSEILGSAKVAAESAQTTVGKQGEKVATAAEGVKKTVVEHIDRAADYVHSKPEEPAKTEEGGVLDGVKKAVGGLFK